MRSSLIIAKLFRVFLITFFILTFFAKANPLNASDTARVVIIEYPNVSPTAQDVALVLNSQFKPVGLVVDIVKASAALSIASTSKQETFSKTIDNWVEIAKKETLKKSGTLAVIGWQCNNVTNCKILIVETKSFAVAVVPIHFELPKKTINNSHQETKISETLTYCVACTAREAIWGSLLPEMNRLVQESKKPSEPLSSALELKIPTPYVDDSANLSDLKRPRFWLESSYIGEFPYPSGHTLNGIKLGTAISPGKYIIPALSFGWLGIRKTSNEFGEVKSFRFPVSLEFRISFAIGPALFAVAPIGRIDIVYARNSPATDSKSIKAEVHAGIETTWNLPLPNEKIELIFGTGILATIVGQQFDISNKMAIPASMFRVIWSAGIAFSPF